MKHESIFYRAFCWLVEKSKYLNPEIMLREWRDRQ